MLKKILKWALYLFLIFLVYAIFQSPEQAAGIVVSAFEGIGAGFEAIFTFFDEVLEQSDDSAA